MKKFRFLMPLFLAFVLVAVCVICLPTNANAYEREGDYEYSVEDGVATIANYKGAGGDITIPSTLGGYPVAAIGFCAFDYNNTITSVTIPGSVKVIEGHAFSYCTKLKSVTLEEGVEKIESYAFSNCYYLLNFSVPNSLKICEAYVFYNTQFALDFNHYDNATYLGNEENPYVLLYLSENDNITSCQIHEETRIIADHAFAYCEELTEIVIPDKVVHIGEWAFDDCDGMQSLTIGKSVEIIGYNAFGSCNKLTSVVLPDSVKELGGCVFSYSYNLRTIQLSENLTTIGWNCFEECSSLESITIPKNVVEINSTAFNGCDSLTGFYVDEDNPVFSSRAGVLYNKDQTKLIRMYGSYEGSYTIPSHVTALGEYSFGYCDGLTSIVISDSVKTIDNNVFYNCRGLTDVTFPKGITKISEGMFRGCEGLKEITIPETVTTLGYFAFALSGLESIDIPDSVVNFGGSEFSDCENLTSVTFPKGITKIPNGMFSMCSRLNSIVIPETVTEIGSMAFESSGLDSVKLPKGLITIGESAFSWTGVESVTIPDTVTTIESNAFYHCGLKTVDIPAGVKTIDNGAFADCWQLDGIWVHEDNPNFSNDPKGVLYNKDQTRILQIPGTFVGAYTIPDTVSEIDSNTLTGCEELTSIAFPENPNLKFNYVNLDCPKLTTVFLSVYVTEIPQHMFHLCESLTDVYYSGTEAQWEQVEIGWYNNYLYSATMHFNHEHEYDESKPVVIQPTCIRRGYTECSCVCMKGQFEVIPANGHCFTNYVSNNDATETEDGTKTAKCEHCDETSTVPDPGSRLSKPDGWNLIGGKWYYYVNNVFKTGWFKDSGYWYYFNAEGVMQTGWLKYGNAWYYLRSGGNMATGWAKVGSVYYYMNKDGIMQTGWVKDGGVWYYMNSSGAMVTGWQKVGSTWYFFKTSGAMQTGWLKQGSVWYYFKSSGAMATGSLKIGSKTYNFNSSGACLNP